MIGRRANVNAIFVITLNMFKNIIRQTDYKLHHNIYVFFIFVNFFCFKIILKPGKFAFLNQVQSKIKYSNKIKQK